MATDYPIDTSARPCLANLALNDVPHISEPGGRRIQRTRRGGVRQFAFHARYQNERVAKVEIAARPRLRRPKKWFAKPDGQLLRQ
jgi:hypothetical protein